MRKLLRACVPGLLLLCCSLALSSLGYLHARHEALARLDDIAQRQLDLYATTLEGELKRTAGLPDLVELDAELRRVLLHPASAVAASAARKRLAALAVRANVMSLFLMDRAGRLLATSDWYQPDALQRSRAAGAVKLQQVLQGRGQSDFVLRHAADPTEYVFIHPFMHDGSVIGIIGFGISLDALESTWRDLAFAPDSEKVMVADENGVVILSSAPGWKLKQAPRDAPGVIYHERRLNSLGWRILILSEQREADAAARGRASVIMAVCALFGLLLLQMRQRRRTLQQVNAELEEKVLQRTRALRLANASLRNEIRQREQAQAELIQASRLAFLGRMSASVSHEIGQPLTALRALASNARIHAERGNLTALYAGLADIGELAGKIGRISMQLKSFAYRNAHAPQRFPLRRALAQLRRLIDDRVAAEQVALTIAVPECEVVCDQTRLEQVLLNLAQNAMDAMRQQPCRALTVGGYAYGARLVLQLRDNGPGIAPDVLPHLFEPFFTTKPCGIGLGLGLAICVDIVREFGGSLKAFNTGNGALFQFDIPLASEMENSHG